MIADFMSMERQAGMHTITNKPIIAYLAPEIPLLSATFVYEEMFVLERRGISIIPVSVRRPGEPATGQADLAARVYYLYQKSKVTLALKGLFNLPLQAGALKAFRWLLADMMECGLLHAEGWKLAFQFLASVKLAGILKQRGCTHLHVHFAHVPTQIAMYASAMANVPYTVMAHANDIFERGLLLPRKAERAVKMLTISEFNRAYLERLGVAAEKLEVVRCGVSFPARAARPAFEQRARYRIGTLGRLVEKKGMDVLIRALADLSDRHYAIELTIAGDGPLREELQQLVNELGMSSEVRFAGSMPHHEVATWMMDLDIFVLACKADANGDMDGIPLVLMEAMSQSVPVISTRLSGIPELIMHERTGLLAEPGNSQDLAMQIDKLLESPVLRSSLALEAQLHVEHEFGQTVNLQRLMSAIGLAAAH